MLNDNIENNATEEQEMTIEEQEIMEEYLREKNLDYAIDNMTNDLVYIEEIGEWVNED
tara:strand:- start:90 stop:263 length:174 start_codon:yes stop_codon:yes gene_type:complete